MTDLIETETNLPAVAGDIFSADNLSDLTEGTGGGFGVLSMRGGKWRVKVGGEETLVQDEDGDPVPSIPVVLVKAQKEVSKLYYEKAYEEGDDNAPDCFSMNGIAPDPTSPDPQSDRCATCPQNQWGSRITEQGRKAKNCSDNRRVAVVPAARKMADADPEILANELYGGGPLLFRVPPTALKDLARYAAELKKQVGENYNAVVTLMGFDPNTSYPKPTFKAVRRLTDEEKMQVVEFYQDGSVDNVLSTHVEAQVQQAAPTPTVDVTFEDDTVPESKPVVEEPKEEPKPKPRKARAKKGNGEDKPVKEAPKDDMESGIDDIMSELDDLG